MKTKNDYIKQNEKQAKVILEGRTIKHVRYLKDEEMEDLGWYKRPIAMFLDNGEVLIITQDDEMNDGGSIWVNKLNTIIPTLD